MSKKIVQPDQPASHLVVFQERAIRRLWQEAPDDKRRAMVSELATLEGRQP